MLSRGDVAVLRNQQSIKPEIKPFELLNGDQVKTGANGKVLINRSGVKLWLGSNSKVSVNLAKPSKKPNQKKLDIIDLVYGKLRNQVETGQGADFRVKVKNVVAGVRGTEYYAHYINRQIQLCTLEGEVDVESDTGLKQTIPKGYGVKIDPGQPFLFRQTHPTTMAAWIQDTQIESESSFVKQDSYAMKSERFYFPISGNPDVPLFAQIQGKVQATYKDNQNLNARSNENVTRYLITPSFQWGQSLGVNLETSINGLFAGKDISISANPALNDDSHSSFHIRNAYLFYTTKDYSVKAGQIPIHLKSRVMLPKQHYTLDDDYHIGFSGDFLFNRSMELSIFASFGQEAQEALDHFNAEDLFGAKLHLGVELGDVAFVRSFNKLNNDQSTNLNYSLSAIRGSLDYALELAFQQLHSSSLTNNKEDSLYTRLELGYSTLLGLPSRFSFDFLRSSEFFRPLLNDKYSLRWSSPSDAHTNIQRLQVSYGLKPLSQLGLKLSYSTFEDLKDDGLRVRTLNQSQSFGNEVSLHIEYNLNEKSIVNLHAWYFDGGQNTTNQKIQSGVLAQYQLLTL